jgi:hypothetical protein
MKRVAALVLGVFLIGCGEMSDPQTDHTAQAVTNNGQICQGANGGLYDPYNPSQGWPLLGWCQWMPSPAGYSQPGCDISGPGPGETYVYDRAQPARHSNCARIPADTVLLFRDLAFNGWDGQLRMDRISIHYITLGPHTYTQFSAGPSFDADQSAIANWTDSPWPAYTGWTTPTGYVPNSIASWSYNGGPID